jgi:uncharacterized membrane protein YkoI
MLKRKAFVVLTLAFVFALTTAGYAKAGRTVIGKDEAKVIALEDAALNEDEVTFIRTKLERDDGRTVYEVEFYSTDTEYDYEIDAYTGEIVSFDSEVEGRRVTRTNRSEAPPVTEYIGEAAAKAIALDLAGLGEAEVRKLKVEFDRDDGRYVYEIEFKNGRTEYEYAIDAVDGTVYEREVDYD